MTETPNTLRQELVSASQKRKTNRYALEIKIQGVWIYYFSSDRFAMSAAIARNLHRQWRILERGKVYLRSEDDNEAAALNNQHPG